jgi:hypothetical protein
MIPARRVRMRRVAVTAVAAVFALAAAAPTATASRADKKAIWGPLTAFPTYHDLGVGIYEMNLVWSAAAPTRPRSPSDPSDPAYRWPSDVTYALGQAARYHMRLLLQVSGTPSWANGGRDPNYPPEHPGDLANFLTAAAREYPSVHLWMIWGEPNRKPNFASLVPTVHITHGAHGVERVRIDRRLSRAQRAAPHLYARMLDASYGALKGVSPSNVVIGGNTYTTGDITTQQWIENLRLPNGRPPRMDLYGHNPFCWRAPNLNDPAMDPMNQTFSWEFDFSDLGRLSRLVNSELARPHQHINLFLSEWMIPTGPDSEINIYTTPAVQAQWITDAWRIVRRSAWIYALGWIHLYDDPPGGSRSGLLYANGKPKPGYQAFKAG